MFFNFTSLLYKSEPNTFCDKLLALPYAKIARVYPFLTATYKHLLEGIRRSLDFVLQVEINKFL